MAQEYVAEHPVEAGDDGAGIAGAAFRRIDSWRRARLEARLEEETDRWAFLDRVAGVAAPVTTDDGATALEIDARLKALASRRGEWDDVFGWCAYAVRRSGLWRTAGFASFDHYCKERLGLSARTVEQRATLEKRLWVMPSLRVARDAGLSYERIRLLSRLPDRETWGGARCPGAAGGRCTRTTSGHGGAAAPTIRRTSSPSAPAIICAASTGATCGCGARRRTRWSGTCARA